MRVSYKKLWKLLIDRDMKKIYSALNCDIGNIMEIIPDEPKGGDNDE